MTSNPFVDSLPEVYSYEAFEALIELRPDKSEVFQNYSHAEREEFLQDDLYVSNRLAWEVYQDISRIIRKGYRTRNPLDNSFIRYNHEWTFSTDQLHKDSFKEKRGIAGVITGPSGFGKTVLIDRLLSLIPQTRVHSFDSPITSSKFLQVVWIKIDCDADSRKETLLNIARQVQSHVPHDIGVSRLSGLNTPSLRKAVVAICRQFAVGLVVIDECQTLTSLPFEKDAKTTSTEFLEKLYQDLGVPLLTIGTPEYRKLLRLRPQTHRRMTQNLSLQLEGYDESDEFWSKLVQVYICNFVFPGSKPPSEAQLQYIHSITCGNVSLLQKLCSTMLILRTRSDAKKFADGFLELAYQQIKSDLVVSKSLLNLDSKDDAYDVDDKNDRVGVTKRKPKQARSEKEKADASDDAGERYREHIKRLRNKR